MVQQSFAERRLRLRSIKGFIIGAAAASNWLIQPLLQDAQTHLICQSLISPAILRSALSTLFAYSTAI